MRSWLIHRLPSYIAVMSDKELCRPQMTVDAGADDGGAGDEASAGGDAAADESASNVDAAVMVCSR